MDHRSRSSLRYQTANQDDAWTLTFGDLEKFALDY